MLGAILAPPQAFFSKGYGHMNNISLEGTVRTIYLPLILPHFFFPVLLRFIFLFFSFLASPSVFSPLPYLRSELASPMFDS